MTYNDTLRIILQNKFDRVENLVQMNHAATLAIPSILAAIWGIEGGLNNFKNAWFLSIISIGLILIWRYFTYFLHNDISKTYIEICRVENSLGIPVEISIFYNIVHSFSKNVEGTSKKSIELLDKRCKNSSFTGEHQKKFS